MFERFLRFEYVVYPLWRRQFPAWARPWVRSLLRPVYPVDVDQHPPEHPRQMAQVLAAWGILRGLGIHDIEEALANSTVCVETATDDPPPPAHQRRVHITAQWEPMEKILMSWGVVYPPLWEMHGQMAEAISQVATVEILVPAAAWARAIDLFLRERGRARMERVCFLVLPTNDIWIRDYGPVMGLDAKGEQVAINAIYDPLPLYPQDDDNAMIHRWAGHYRVPVHDLDLHTEGGNLWSDGLGTLLMSEQILKYNPYHTRESLERYLHSVVDYEKLIITPRMAFEETGHIDMLMKLASADTLMMAAPGGLFNGGLRQAHQLMRSERNAAGRQYTLIDLPTPPLYYNWLVYNIRRSYTNALTVNGRVLVPAFGIPEDEQACRIYEQAMPGYEIIPIDTRVGINGSGAVHCMTKEIPKAVGDTLAAND